MTKKSNKGEGYNKGDIYEDKITKILINKKYLSRDYKRAGATDKADVEIKCKGKKIKIEIKADLNADFGQKSCKWSKNKGWFWAKDDEVTKFYNDIEVLKTYVKKNCEPIRWNKDRGLITQNDKESDQKNFNRPNIEIPLETLFNYYKIKGVHYIQLQNYGFYHLGKDSFKIGTHQFNGKMTLRLRAKSIHNHDPDGNKTPWNYNFYGVLKMSKKPTTSQYDLEELDGREFPFKD